MYYYFIIIYVCNVSCLGLTMTLHSLEHLLEINVLLSVFILKLVTRLIICNTSVLLVYYPRGER